MGGALAALPVITGIIGAGTSVIGALQSNKKPATAPAPTYDANAEKKKAATQEAEANKKRIMQESDTIKTTALGNAGTTETKKKTLLGG